MGVLFESDAADSTDSDYTDSHESRWYDYWSRRVGFGGGDSERPPVQKIVGTQSDNATFYPNFESGLGIASILAWHSWFVSVPVPESSERETWVRSVDDDVSMWLILLDFLLSRKNHSESE